MNMKPVFVTDGIVSGAEDTRLLLQTVRDQDKLLLTLAQRKKQPIRARMLDWFGRLSDEGQMIVWLIPGIPLSLWAAHLIDILLFH